ncbi:MAG: hypothetical protein ACP5N2_07385 [Candidatus Nanoarchaeia archaeon]
MCLGPCTLFGGFLQNYGLYLEIFILVLVSLWIFLDKTKYKKLKGWQRAIIFLAAIAIILFLVSKTPKCGCIDVTSYI